MFDAASADAAAREAGEIGHNLPLELAVELPSQKVHHLLGAKALNAVTDQLWIEFAQTLAVLKQNVGGLLALCGYPVVAAAIQ